MGIHGRGIGRFGTGQARPPLGFREPSCSFQCRRSVEGRRHFVVSYLSNVYLPRIYLPGVYLLGVYLLHIRSNANRTNQLIVRKVQYI